MPLTRSSTLIVLAVGAAVAVAAFATRNMAVVITGILITGAVRVALERR